ncbi:hypothetical protein ACTFIY_003446 [Dictyostelium cf. discoideum]
MSATKIHNSYNDVPSAVLHIRSIPQGTTENDLFKITFDHKFGKCVSVRILERFHQALLEMDSVESATRLLKYSQKNSLLLHGKPVQISFSKSQSINQPTPQSPTNTTTNTTSSSSSSHRSSPPSSSSSSSYNGLPQAGSRQSNFSPNTNNSAPIAGTVLLSTIENPGSNSITIDHLYHVFSSCGEVLRIVMFNKNNLQALIEFSTVESALHAKKTLSNHSLFHGGQCTLKLEVSKTDRLNITQNTDRAKDFSKSLPTVNQSSQQQQSSYYQSNGNNNNNNNNNQQQQQHHNNNNNNHHHQSSSSSSSSSPSQGSHHHHHNNNNNNNNNHHSHHHSSPSQHPHHSGSVSTNQQVGNHHSHHHGHNHHGSNHHNHHHQNGGNIGHHRTTVLLVHGLDEAVMTCDRIFNLFCVYGNVQRVKILSSKKGAALVQMEDVQQAEAVIRFYHQMPLFKDTLQINYSKHLSITDSHNPESPTLSKDFAQSNLNRFTHPINTYKHLYKPSQTLYFSNVPKDFTETNFNQLFQSLNLQKPVGFKIFSAQLAPGASSSSSSVPTVASPTTPTGVVTGVSSPSVNGGGGAGSGASTVGTNIANNTTTSVNGISSNSSTPEPSKHADKIVGLLEFSSPANAIDALVLLNNSVLPNSNHMGLRLSFSNSTVLPKSSTTSNNNNTNNTTTTSTTTTTNNSNNITSPQQPQQFQQPQQPQQQSPTTQKLF